MSAPQHMTALAKANAIRLGRAQAKREIRAGKLTVVEALDLEECRSMPVMELLVQQRRWGAARARAMLAKARIAEACTVGGLTDRQRRELGAGPSRQELRPPKPVAEFDPTRGNGLARKACRGCGIPLAERTPEMLCGFCIGEAAA